MKHIEQKLISDARAFKHAPDAALRDNIMQCITTKPKTVASQRFTLFRWLAPTSLAVIALLVVVLINQSNNANNEAPSLDIQNTVSNSVEFNIDVLALNIEYKLTNNIQLEQQAIVNDLNYLKSLLIL